MHARRVAPLRRLQALLVAGLVGGVLGGLLAIGPDAAASVADANSVTPGTASATPASNIRQPATRVSSADIALSLSTSTQVLQPQRDLTVTATITNNSTAALTTPSLELSMSNRLFTTTTQVRTWFDSTSSTDATQRVRIRQQSTDTIAAGSSATVTFTLPSDSMPTWAYNGSSGVFGFGLRLTSSASDAVWRPTAIAWNVNQSDLKPVNVIAPITTSTTTTGEYLSADALKSLTAPGGELSTQLDALDGLDVQLAVDPRIVASIRKLGTNAPASASAWLQRLDDFSQRQSLLWADADPSLLAAAGVTRINSALTSADSTDGQQQTNQGDTVLAIGRADTLTQAGLDLLARGNSGTLVIDTDRLGDPSSDITVSQVRGTPIIGANHNLADAITQALTETNATDDQAATRVSAMATVLGLSTRDFSAVTTVLPRGWGDQGTRVRQVLNGINSAPTQLHAGVQVTGETTSAPDAQVSLGSSSVTDADTAALTALGASLGPVDRIASVSADSNRVSGTARRQIATLSSSVWTHDDTWRQAVTDQATANQQLLSAVAIASTTNLTLVAGSSQIPVAVRNTTNQAVTVQVQISPTNGRVVTDSPVTLTIDADSTATGTVPVRAIANGTVVLNISIANTAGDLIGDPVSRQMDVKAEWETIGTIIFIAATGGLFGFGIIRSVVRNRRAQREASGNTPDESPDGSAA